MSIAPVFALGKKLTCAPPFFSKPRKSCLRSVLNITLLIYIAISMLKEIKGYLKGMRGIYPKQFILRSNAIRIISVRRARKKEAKFYEQKETG
jgi:hypothetical protein